MPVCFAVTKDGFCKRPMLSPRCKFGLKIGSVSKEALSGLLCDAAVRKLEVGWIQWGGLGIKSCLFRVKLKSSHVDKERAAPPDRACCVRALVRAVMAEIGDGDQGRIRQ